MLVARILSSPWRLHASAGSMIIFRVFFFLEKFKLQSYLTTTREEGYFTLATLYLVSLGFREEIFFRNAHSVICGGLLLFGSSCDSDGNAIVSHHQLHRLWAVCVLCQSFFSF